MCAGDMDTVNSMHDLRRVWTRDLSPGRCRIQITECGIQFRISRTYGLFRIFLSTCCLTRNVNMFRYACECYDVRIPYTVCHLTPAVMNAFSQIYYSEYASGIWNCIGMNDEGC